MNHGIMKSTPTSSCMLQTSNKNRFLALLLFTLPLLFQQTQANSNITSTSSSSSFDGKIPTFSVLSGSFQQQNEADLAQLNQLLNSQTSQRQINNLYTLSGRLLANMQDQSNKNSATLSECYQELGKYTRMVVANKRRTISTNTARTQAELDGMSRMTDSEIVDVEIGEEVKYGNKKYQLPAMLVQELGFYLLVGISSRFVVCFLVNVLMCFIYLRGETE